MINTYVQRKLRMFDLISHKSGIIPIPRTFSDWAQCTYECTIHKLYRTRLQYTSYYRHLSNIILEQPRNDDVYAEVYVSYGIFDRRHACAKTRVNVKSAIFAKRHENLDTINNGHIVMLYGNAPVCNFCNSFIFSAQLVSCATHYVFQH